MKWPIQLLLEYIPASFIIPPKIVRLLAKGNAHGFSFIRSNFPRKISGKISLLSSMILEISSSAIFEILSEFKVGRKLIRDLCLVTLDFSHI